MDTQAERIKYVLSLEKSKGQWRKKFGSKEFMAASALNQELFGIPLNKSRKCQCIEDMFFLLNRMDTAKLNQINTIKMSRFKLKKGKVIMVHGLTTALTSANMTDEKAIELLKKHKGHIKNFESFPPDWEQIVFNNTPPHVPTKSEIKARAKEAGLPANSTLEQVEAKEKEIEAAKAGEAEALKARAVSVGFEGELTAENVEAAEAEFKKRRAIACGLSEDASEEDIQEIEQELKDRAEAIGYTGGLSLENIENAEKEFKGKGDSGKGKAGKK